MCASAVTVALQPRERSFRRAAEVAALGIAVAVLAVLAFGTFHAILIAPIWSRLAGGLPATLATSIALAWSFDRVSRSRETPVRPRDGAIFGVAVFAALLPATAVDAAMRAQGYRLGDTMAGMVVAIALFAASGFSTGWAVSRRKGAALSVAAAALTLMIVAGGPLPITRSIRGALLSLAVGAICVGSGLLLAILRPHVNGPFD